ncbi:unnamed protein product [Kluyveromyces dobzhanskii CBS 2104]|uniref:WGS project CCBQ000000000 data, contig 00107 n=1 Tax=Kluyveromyces dobzhanskii CBS 2104 TaxID=1427455 RepID=A0A0A8KZ99_9SACH|nr:unnamed protein product [Kluyveromyces dobzhanskii CBS 2104]
MANLLLQDPFGVLKEYPEKLTHTLEVPVSAVCVKFSPRGDYLAVGCSNGAIIIYDLDSLKPITMLGTHSGAHTRSVQSVCWSYDGRYLWSSGRDWYVKLWDMAQPTKCFQLYKYDGPVWSCLAVRWNVCIVTVVEEQTAFVLAFDESTQTLSSYALSDPEQDISRHGYTLVACPHPTIESIVLTGTSKGWISAFQLNLDGPLDSMRCCFEEKIANANVKEIIVSPSGTRVAINGSDRTIRQYQMISEEVTNDGSADANGNTLSTQAPSYTISLELEHKYQDIINRLQWNTIIFSNHSGEYLVASAHGSSAHDLYLWETNSGTLVRVLEGADEELLDIDWNFYNMRIASNGFESGWVYMWSIVIPPKWSALAPDFEEVEENIDYQEKESEFDVMDDDNNLQAMTEAEEVAIDLCTPEKYDVRGNDLSVPSYVIPIDYEGLMVLQHWKDLDNQNQ